MERPPQPLADHPVQPLADWDAALQILGTSRRHLARLVTERRIPFVRVGGKVRFEPGALAGWIAANRVDVAEEA